MVWHVYEIEKSASSMTGMLGMSEWKARLETDAGAAAVELLDVELDGALDAARSAGWAGNVQGEPRIFVLPNEEDFQFGFVWTGTRTTIMSPLALPWMTTQLVADC
jgi:hypothetical protein